jgi:hypothetical protein
MEEILDWLKTKMYMIIFYKKCLSCHCCARKFSDSISSLGSSVKILSFEFYKAREINILQVRAENTDKKINCY